KALASLRMEKAYRDYGHDIDNTDTVLEAGLGFAVDLKKPGGFVGKDAVVAMIEAAAVPGGVIDQAAIDGARWDVEIAGRRYPATVSLRPLYDPENKKIK